MASRKDLSPELQAAFADADLIEAKEYLEFLLTDPTSRKSERLKADLEVKAAEERYDAIVNEYGLWEK
jgi:hypothetical protein